MRRALGIAALVLAAATPPGASAASLQDARRAAVHWGRAQVGRHERGTSNCSPQISRWLRDMHLATRPCRPWCGAFVHEAFLRGGIRLSARLIDPDRSYTDAVHGRRGLRQIPMGDVRPGDLLFFALRPGVQASHIAIVTSTPRGGRVHTVEGNVSNAVRVKLRGLRYAVLAARVTGDA